MQKGIQCYLQNILNFYSTYTATINPKLALSPFPMFLYLTILLYLIKILISLNHINMLELFTNKIKIDNIQTNKIILCLSTSFECIRVAAN